MVSQGFVECNIGVNLARMHIINQVFPCRYFPTKTQYYSVMIVFIVDN